jgi:restriction system protein
VIGFLTLWPLWLAVAGLGLLSALAKRLPDILETRRLRRAGVEDMDRMTGLQFEKFLAGAMARAGYKIQRTPHVGDYGADLIVTKDGVRTAVEAKRHRRSVGVEAVRAVAASRDYYECDKAMVITTSHYTKPARRQARASRVILWDRADLVELVTQHPARYSASGAAAAEPSESNQARIAATCLLCGRSVSNRVREYCEANSTKFGGAIYSYEHQRRRDAY